MARRIISTWFYQESAEEQGIYAQVRGDSSSQAFRDVYRRCLAVFFASARRANPDAELVLALNRSWDPSASRVARQVHETLTALGVEQVVLDYTFRPPETWRRAWRNQFFVLDVLHELAERVDDDALVLLLDSDIAWTGSSRTERMWQDLAEQGCLTYHVQHPPADIEQYGEWLHGLTDLSRDMGASLEPGEKVAYSGGEFVALRGDACAQVAAAAREAWPEVLARHRDGRPNVHEEAYLLSHLYATLRLPTGQAGSYVKRLWTQPLRYRDVGPEDLELVLWHVPAEKLYGLRRLYGRLRRRGMATFLSEPHRTWHPRTAKMLGIPANPPTKVVRDVTRAATARMRDRISR
jgi:hypothetical protein